MPQTPPPLRGTVIVVQQQQRQGRLFSPAEIAAFLGALALTFGQFIAFINGYDALNRDEPDTEAAGAWLTGSLLAGIAGVAFVAWAGYLRRAHPALVVAGGGVGLLIGASLPKDLGFGFLGSLGWLIWEAILAAILLIPLIIFLVMVFGPNQRVAWGLGVGIILLHAAAYGMLVSFMLTNLDQLAVEAREANQSPLHPLLVFAAAAAAVVLARRRSR